MSGRDKIVLLPEPIEEDARKLLESRGVRIVQSPDPRPESVKPLMAQADAVVLRTGIRMSSDLIECGARLAQISRTGTGVDNVDVDCATRNKVIVSSSVGANTHTVAEHTLALILALAKSLPALDRETRAGNFRIRYSYLPRDLRGAVLGAVGLGRIGREVAHVCATVFGMSVMAFDAYLPDAAKAREESWVRFCELDTLLSEADVVTIHVPLTPQTERLIDARRLALMKKGAFIVNTSRGGIIDEEALADALTSGKIGGAGIDVFAKEPPLSTNPLLAAPTALITPHAAALTGECVRQMAVCAAQRVLDQFDGIVPDSVANPEVLKTTRWSSLRRKEEQQS